MTCHHQQERDQLKICTTSTSYAHFLARPWLHFIAFPRQRVHYSEENHFASQPVMQFQTNSSSANSHRDCITSSYTSLAKEDNHHLQTAPSMATPNNSLSPSPCGYSAPHF
ncbi:hypothetical protein DY000_02045769 [Brassica cretica]|uniref:Uncharacterized protein n=1 Tax=Brassica cretica TaxID=69181 RepID=A0ABQ7F4T0_BRACR|nr:hypothetical protein DY000_02045769 [Brassica cretica]